MPSTISAKLAATIRMYLTFHAGPALESQALGALLIDLGSALLRRGVTMSPPNFEHQFSLHMAFPASALSSWSLDVQMLPELLFPPPAPAARTRILLLGTHLSHSRVDSLLPSVPIVRGRFAQALGDSLSEILAAPTGAATYSGYVSLMGSP